MSVDHEACHDPACGPCNTTKMLEGFGAAQAPQEPCPHCGRAAEAGAAVEMRVTESEAATEDPVAEADSAIGPGSWVSWRASGSTAKGRVASVHKSSTVPGVSRKVVGTDFDPAARIKIYEKADDGYVPSGRFTAMKVSDLTVIDALPETAGEAINGMMSANDLRELLCQALEDQVRAASGVSWAYVNVVDFTDSDVVYRLGDDLWQAPFTLTGRVVSLGTGVKVVPITVFEPVDTEPTTAAEETTSPGGEADSGELVTEAIAEETVRVEGRVVEAKGTDSAGNRVFRVRLIAYGDSKNGRRYPEAVMREACVLYDGAKAYDHHRTSDELASSTIAGLVGSFRNVEAGGDGLWADLLLLPSAAHAAEALDASIAAQQESLPPLVGLSHDVIGRFRPVMEGGRRIAEATEITKVHSVDLVESPAAGGRAERAVAGGDTNHPGIEPAHLEEDPMPPTLDEILGALKEATPEQLAAAGLTHAPEATVDPDVEPEVIEVPVVEAKTDGHAKTSFMGGLLIKSKIADAGLPEACVEAVTNALGDRISEADVDAQVAALKHGLGLVERAGLAPKAAPGEGVQHGQEAHDKKTKALDAFFDGKFSEGYHSFRQAFLDVTGRSPRSWDEDYNRVILRESFNFYDSSVRSTESLTSSSWAEVLGDSVTRRLVAEYSRPDLGVWRQIVSAVNPVSDFRAQKIGRVGGYGVLPTVNQGQPYQPLTSPGDEEATYTVTKKGGTEDLTLEMIANDDLRAIRNIPISLGLAAAQTLFRFVFDLLASNATCTYDSTALFHTNHANTANPAVLGQSTLSAGRKAMRKQTAYGDSSDVLSIVPKYILVPSDLEELAWQLCTSAVAIPSTPAGPSDTPNIHQGLKPLVVDYWTDANDWFLVGDPTRNPTIEIGFYQGRETPELFTQADPTNGSAFNADVITYKIRHTYNGTVLDHRPFYRGANA